MINKLWLEKMWARTYSVCGINRLYVIFKWYWIIQYYSKMFFIYETCLSAVSSKWIESNIEAFQLNVISLAGLEGSRLNLIFQ